MHFWWTLLSEKSLIESFHCCRVIKKMKTQSQSSLLSSLRSGRGEKILEVDGTLTTQPVLEHVGISAWPGVFLFSQYWLRVFLLISA